MFDSASPWDLPRIQQAKRLGAVALSVYIVGTPGGMRHASKADVDLIWSQGLGVYPNWERAADFFGTCSLADAKNAGVEALAACRDLGIPDDGSVAVSFSFDFAVPPNRFREVADKLAAARDGMGGHYQAVGYGQSSLCDYWPTVGLPGPHWLMMSTWNLPYFPASKNVAVVQAHDTNGNWLGSAVPGADINLVTQPNALGAWWPTNSPYGGDMPLTPDDVNAIWDEQMVNEPTVHGTARSRLYQANKGISDLAAQLASVQSTVDTLSAAVAKLQTAGVDPAAVAAQIVAHLGIEVVAR